jgi:hypothetical protein
MQTEQEVDAKMFCNKLQNGLEVGTNRDTNSGARDSHAEQSAGTVVQE